MIKLTSKNNWNKGVFYFRTMEDCNEFLYVFQDHFCNVPWNTPIEVPNTILLEQQQAIAMSASPKERAEKNLSWGFSIAGTSLTSTQQAYVNEIGKLLN